MAVKHEIKRRIIKTTITVTKRNETVVKNIIIPDNTFAIVGVKVTSSLPTTDPLETAVRYFGVDAIGLTNPTTLFKENIENKNKVFELTPAVDEKIYYAAPKKHGRPDLYTDNVLGGFMQPKVVSVIDPDTGYTQKYYLWESQAFGTGSTIQIAVKYR
jgi:hypothetical protein